MNIELEPTSLLFLMYDEGDEAFARPLWQHCPCGRARTEWLTPEEVARAEPAVTRELRGALRFNGDDQVNPYKFADALRAGARHHGARVLPHTEVTGIEVERGRVVAVRTRAERLPCRIVVNAAGAWAGLRPGSPDELPILGPVEGLEGYLNACGHFRTGVVTSPLTGRMLAEFMTGDELSYPIEPFLLSRFPPEQSWR
jgi:glycine/D-amino acid oxidase-like deaminating enzyme